MANDNINWEQIPVDMTPAADYVPWDGFGSSDLIEKSGIFKTRAVKTALQLTRPEAGKQQKVLLLIQHVTDPEDLGGYKVNNNIHLTGTDSKGRPLFRQFLEMLTGAGYSQEEIRTFATKGQNGQTNPKALQKFVDDEIVAKGRPIYCQIEAEEFTNREGQKEVNSKVQNYVQPKQYEEAKANGTWRRANSIRPAGSAGATATGWQASSGGMLNGLGQVVGQQQGGGQPLGGGAPATELGAINV